MFSSDYSQVRGGALSREIKNRRVEILIYKNRSIKMRHTEGNVYQTRGNKSIT